MLNPKAAQCTAKSKRSGKRCKNPAVNGWNVCRMHGAGGGRPIVHGMYSEKLRQEYRAEIDAMMSQYGHFVRRGNTWVNTQTLQDFGRQILDELSRKSHESG